MALLLDVALEPSDSEVWRPLKIDQDLSHPERPSSSRFSSVKSAIERKIMMLCRLTAII